MLDTVMECDEHESLKTLLPFNEFEVLEGAKEMDIKDESISRGSDQIKVLNEFAYSIGHS
jgi:hypothetical protein